MQSLSPEVIRADDETRAVYQDGMLKVVKQVAKGLEGSPIADRRKRAWTLLSVLSGGVTLARAVHDADVASRNAKAVKGAALAAAS
jgi:hypothetical protein